MRHGFPARPVPRHRLNLHRSLPRRDERGDRPARLSDLILALLAVSLLGGLALLAALALAGGRAAL
ncbi:hypothetical protein [Methylobacterium durans]|uniref:Uncharacterized protein n=1 Tax=Methylobacterium durans TaxID=2202825 RepID=A0A2U8W251_9HYPH|nr:hypothetical protein [Methylobacterium durans]AWN40173.1 hypothetical protein DK389_05990 [Methylobacterium durans]